jgi:hypothetical protein
MRKVRWHHAGRERCLYDQAKLASEALVKTAKVIPIVAIVMIHAMTQTHAQTGALREPVAVVELDGKWGFINTSGKYAISFSKARERSLKLWQPLKSAVSGVTSTRQENP